MDFNLSEQEQQFYEAVAGFAKRHLADGALARARTLKTIGGVTLWTDDHLVEGNRGDHTHSV